MKRTKYLTLKLTTFALAATLAGATLAQARMRGEFDLADANRDGRVTLEEYSKYATDTLMESDGRLAKKFKSLTPQDRAERLKKRFDKHDRGHKGYLDRNDWSGS